MRVIREGRAGFFNPLAGNKPLSTQVSVKTTGGTRTSTPRHPAVTRIFPFSLLGCHQKRTFTTASRNKATPIIVLGSGLELPFPSSNNKEPFIRCQRKPSGETGFLPPPGNKEMAISSPLLEWCPENTAKVEG